MHTKQKKDTQRGCSRADKTLLSDIMLKFTWVLITQALCSIFILIGSFISWNSIMQKEIHFQILSRSPHSVHYENILSFLLLPPSFFFCYTWVFILFMCFMRSIKFSICAWHSAFTRHSVYLCKNETIEICCMATRYGETSSIKTEYTIFFPPRLVPYFFFLPSPLLCAPFNVMQRRYMLEESRDVHENTAEKKSFWSISLVFGLCAA